MTTNAVWRRRVRDERSAREGRRPSTPIATNHDHIGVCTRCDRTGLITPEGICTGTRATDKPPTFFEMRSKRCDAIFESRQGWRARPLDD